MNEFYSIADEKEEPVDDFQLKNLGSQTIMAIIGKPTRRGWGESRDYESQRFYRDTKPEDYDNLLASKLIKCKPPYELTNILDYHLNYYSSQMKGDKQKFVQQIKYVVLPIIRKRKNKEVQIELIEEWINTMNDKKDGQISTTFDLGDINAPTQFLVNSDNSSQSQQVIYNKEDIKTFLEILKSDIAKLDEDLSEEFCYEIDRVFKQLEANKDVKGRLLTIGGMMKDVGISVFSNLVASPVFELLKPLLGF